MAVSIPLNSRHFLHGHSFTLHFFRKRQWPQGVALPVDVEIFVQTVHKEIKEFLRILLSINRPLPIQAPTEIAERSGHDDFDVAFPQGPDKICVQTRHYTLRALPILLHIIPVPIIDKELAHQDCRAETLNG